MKKEKQYLIISIMSILLLVSVCVNITQYGISEVQKIRDVGLLPLEESIVLELYWNLSHESNTFVRLYNLTIYRHWNDGLYYAKIGQMKFRDNEDFYSGLDSSKAYNVTLHIDKLNLTDITIIEID